MYTYWVDQNANRPQFYERILDILQQDPDAAKSLYVADLAIKRPGNYAVLGVAKLDGRPVLGRSPVLERIGEAQSSEYVVRARRLDGDLWEVEATAL